MRVWLQDDSRKTKYAGQTVTIDNFKLITQSPQAGELTFYDKTTGDPSLGAGWATKNNRAIWINQAGKSEYEKLSRDSSGNYFIKLGSDYTDNPNAAITFYSCESTVTAMLQNGQPLCKLLLTPNHRHSQPTDIRIRQITATALGERFRKFSSQVKMQVHCR